MYFKISYCGSHTKVIKASSEYEAIGFYLTEFGKELHEEDEEHGMYFAEDLDVEEMPAEERIEISCVGFPIYQTLEEMHKEQGNEAPCVVCSLME